MLTDHIKGLPGWYEIRLGEIGHHCEANVFRVTGTSETHCKCGAEIPR